MSARPEEADAGERGLIGWFARNPVAANLLMGLLLVGGAVIAAGTKVEVFPEIDPRTISVTVPYPGASPAEVEEGICRRVEEAITGVEGIDRVRSVSMEGVGTVSAELDEGADDRVVLDDVKSAVETLVNFPPEDAEDVRVVDTRVVRSVIQIAFFGDASERTLRELAFRVRDELTGLEGISMASVQGVRDYELAVEISERALRERGLSFEAVAQAVRGFSVNLPGGSIRTEGGEILLRTHDQAYDRLDFEELVVSSGRDGSVIRLRDVATVRDGFEDVDRASLFNGKPASFVTVSRVGDQGALDVEGRVFEYLAGLSLPDGISATTWQNSADTLRSRIDLLTRNGLMGLVLVFGVLVLFLDLRLAFWTTMGIPISFLGAFFGISALGGSINMISLFAFIVVLGIVVDDAIVVGENVFAKLEAGIEPMRAATEGLREVLAPVTVGILTTVLAFAPLYLTEGFFGDILWVVPVVVISVLLVSLIEAVFILPAHLSHGRRHRGEAARGAIPWVQRRLRAALQAVVDRVYAPLLERSLRYRYVTIAAAVSALLLAVGLVRGGFVRFTLFPEIEADDVSVRVTMVGGTPASETRRVMERLLDAASQVQAELEDRQPPGSPPLFLNVAATLGAQPFGGGGGPAAGAGDSGSNAAEVAIELSPSEQRVITTREVVERWRELVGEVPGATSLDFTSSLISAGDDISVELAHADPERLLAASEAVKRHLGDFEGVSEVSDSFEPGKRELNFSLTDAGLAAGLSLNDLARQVRQAFYGFEAQRFQRGRDEIKVLVRYSEDERRTLATIDDMRVRLPDATEVPFRTVATFGEGRGYATIERTDRRRVVRVTADVDEERASAGDINQGLAREFLPALLRDIPGLAWSFEGAERERTESLGSLVKALGVALLCIFALIAAQLKSYVQPLVIMSVIPIGIVGAVLGHLALGYDLSFFSSFGVVALAGVVVNDSLVLMDMINRQRRRGVAPLAAALAAGARRFRPILFTTLTTCAGLAPMIAERSVQAKFLIPMAISLAAGVAFATLLTLIAVPALYLITEDVRAVFGRLVRAAVEGEPGDDSGGELT